MAEPQKPWLSLERGIWEVNETIDTETIRVNIGSATVEIEKLYGPLAAETVRVRLDRTNAEWVVERRNATTEVEWEEKTRWDCQETFSEDNDV